MIAIKTVELHSVPTKETLIEDTALKTEKRVIGITYSLTDNCYIVQIEPDADNFNLAEKSKCTQVLNG